MCTGFLPNVLGFGILEWPKFTILAPIETPWGKYRTLIIPSNLALSVFYIEALMNSPGSALTSIRYVLYLAGIMLILNILYTLFYHIKPCGVNIISHSKYSKV